MNQRLEAKVYGRVQMVMFRDFARRKAKRLSLCGYVKNLDDGTVWVVAEGERNMLEQFLGHIHRGPMFSRVEDVEIEWKEAAGEFKDFVIEYS